MSDAENIPQQPPDSAVENQLREAEAILYRVVNRTDPDTGQIIPQKVETQLYRDYLDNQKAYNEARVAYSKAYLEAQKTPAGRNTWPILASTLQLPVQTAYDRWRASGADKIERAIAIINSLTDR